MPQRSRQLIALSPVSLQEDHHDDTGEEQIFLFFREIGEPVDAEAALQDGGLFLNTQYVPAVQFRQVGGVEEEAAEGEGFHYPVEYFGPGVLLADRTSLRAVSVVKDVGAAPQRLHSTTSYGTDRVTVRATDRVPGAEVHHPVGLHPEQQAVLGLVAVDSDVLLQFELLFAHEGDLAPRGVFDPYARPYRYDLEAKIQRIAQHGPLPSLPRLRWPFRGTS